MKTNSREQTIEFAENFAKTLQSGDILLLSGDLGAGKTTFVQGLANGLGLDVQITSPTYAYMNSYDDKLYHFDCYRLKNGMEAELLGLTDYFYLDGICVLEWAENIVDVLPKHCKKINIKKVDENTREIEVE